jgi:hypothetical protein
VPLEIAWRAGLGIAVTAWPATAGTRDRDRSIGPVLAGAAALLALLFMLTTAVVGLVHPGGSTAERTSSIDERVSPLAVAEIPPLYLRYYEEAARRYGLDWAILAGIGKVECDHGRDQAPSCTQEGVTNSAGAGGPTQFIASTWARYGVDGNGDGRIDRWDPADAIYSAANLLRASGAPSDYRRAVFAYNHAAWYVIDVEHWAAKYRGSSQSQASLPGTQASADAALQSGTATPIRFVSGERALLSREDGHLAHVPVNVPAAVQAMIVAGNELQDLRYGPGGHPDPRGAFEEDCSSTVNYVLYRSGIRSIAEIVSDNPLAQSYMDWGAPGPGRWVTIYATASPTPHVFIVIAGLRLDTSHNGTDVGPNRNEDGPRWRIYPGIPTWARWSVRHPPGL